MLAGAFNHMLTQIQESERKLHSQLGRLGLLQHITRAIGERQDIHSIFQVVLDSLDRNFRVRVRLRAGLRPRDARADGGAHRRREPRARGSTGHG